VAPHLSYTLVGASWLFNRHISTQSLAKGQPLHFLINPTPPMQVPPPSHFNHLVAVQMWSLPIPDSGVAQCWRAGVTTARTWVRISGEGSSHRMSQSKK